MTNIPWHAYFYAGTESSRPPSRTEVIEAECENDAAKVAKSHMGNCKRVEIVGPRWANAQSRVIISDDVGPSSLSHLH
jgi:hypothetical protein